VILIQQLISTLHYDCCCYYRYVYPLSFMQQIPPSSDSSPPPPPLSFSPFTCPLPFSFPPNPTRRPEEHYEPPKRDLRQSPSRKLNFVHFKWKISHMERIILVTFMKNYVDFPLSMEHLLQHLYSVETGCPRLLLVLPLHHQLSVFWPIFYVHPGLGRDLKWLHVLCDKIFWDCWSMMSPDTLPDNQWTVSKHWM